MIFGLIAVICGLNLVPPRELLNITQLCERIPGLSYHSFKKLAKEHRFKDIKGRYSLTAVKAALQSH
ncbi:hypothetical protein [Acinetobacter pittii]|uniref:hypothetical protein n=1 Tax=Acinetobacter pittii TaxID=48296 RepID=UPI0009D77007|nr:hypothetical protein [Acinetobacter pittii]OTL21609.1 hypothetical protein B9X78_10440 [Acinetobacter pittii]